MRLSSKIIKYANKEIRKIDISSDKIQVSLLNIGAAIYQLKVKDKHDNWQNIVLSYKNIEQYLIDNKPAIGVVPAVISNRIHNAEILLNGEKYQLNANEFANALHSGDLRYLLWGVETFSKESTLGVIFTIQLPHLYHGLPGSMILSIKYSINDQGDFYIEYIAKAVDKTIVANMTNHSYFNLDGTVAHGMSNHFLQINAQHYLQLNDMNLPTGVLEFSEGAFDWQKEKNVADMLSQHNLQLQCRNGYDHYFVFDKPIENKEDFNKFELPCNLTIRSNLTGITMSITSTYPGVQLYTGNYLSEHGNIVQGNLAYLEHSGICLETHYHPNGFEYKKFPNISINSNSTQHNITKYCFDIVD